MSETHAATPDHHEPGLYEIRIKGHLADRWAEWFEGLTITREDNGETLLSGPVVDQAALHGLLKKVRDLGLPLLSVMQVDPRQAKGPDAGSGTDDHHSKKETNT
ncbi:MAG: hypothetical protein DCC55_31115 [Chloroflexi bacterium]|nr:MAG: hypothetical protein DCC55_31115 [Chloroflexota bacterium]